MGKHRIFRAIFIRIVFTIHALLAIWLVTEVKNDEWYWYLSMPLCISFFETVVTLTVRSKLEWKWFCPSVFLYLASIVPAIWLLELDKVERRMKALGDLPLNITTGGQLKELNNIIGIEIKLPDISLSTETWITLIEQFLMLILIIGRWLLPKGDLTRDQLSQLLLVYIGTAADIIEFFDSFKDDKIASEPVLVLLTLGIWSWSLIQFTVVLTATKARKSRLTTTGPTINTSDHCCTIDVWSILLNITLQDGPFLGFRLLLITHYQIISYMNIFFTCKNTLVILLQVYRLYVVYSEHKRQLQSEDYQLSSISIISKNDLLNNRRPRRPSSRISRDGRASRTRREPSEYFSSDSEGSIGSRRRSRAARNKRKDTGYSTATSQMSSRNNADRSRQINLNRERNGSQSFLDNGESAHRKQKLRRTDNETRGSRKTAEALSEESDDQMDRENDKRGEIRRKNQKNGRIVSKSDSDQYSD